MADRIAGITIEISADASKFQSTIRGLDSSLKTTQSNLRDINKLLKLDPKNTELLRQKQQELSKAIKTTEDRLKELKAEQANVAKGTAEWDSLQREIIDTEQKLKGLNTEMKNFGSVAAQQIKATGQEFKNFGGKLSGIGKDMTTRITLPLVALGGLAMKTASDYEENLNKIDVAFGDSSGKVREFADNAMDMYGLSKVAASGSASAFGALAKGVGVAEDEAADMSIQLTGLTSDLSSYFNTSNDVAAKALESIFTGESEALKKFGVVMTETNLKQFAEEHGMVYSELSQVEKTMLRYNFVLEKTKDAQGDYSRTSDGTANSTKTFKAALQDLATTFGTELLPIITPLIQGLTDIIKSISSLPEPVKRIIVIGGLILAAIGPILTAVGGLISGIGSIMLFAPLLSGVLLPVIGVITGLALAITGVVLAIKNWDKIKKWFSGLLNSIKESAAQFKADFIEGWRQTKDDFVQTWDQMKTNVSNKWNEIKTTADSTWTGITNTLTSKWDELKTKASDRFNQIRDTIREKVQALRNLMNFSWSLPHIKLPHFSIYGSFSLNPPRVPHFSVQWYKKAYQNPVLFTSPTVLQTPYGAKGFGDGSGGEVVLGMNKLRELVGAEQGDVVINVYATEGMNINQLADKIQDRFVQLQRQRSAAYA